MKMFDLKGTVLALNNPNVVSLLNSIELYRGKTLSVQNLKKLDSLKNIARKSGAIASCYLGNVFLSEAQEKDLFEKGKPAETFTQHVVKGYVEALDLIDEVYKFQPFDRSFISTLHFYMYRGYNPEIGGNYKDTQNYIQEMMPDGSYRTIFVPAAPEEVAPLLDNLIYQFNLLASDEEVNKLVLIAAFMLDFMCIHPYNHGNGRLSRLILNFLLKKFGYLIDDYFSISYIIKQRIGEYIDAFEVSAKGWEDNDNDYSVYVSFVLRSILEAYRKLDYILEVNGMNGTAEEKIYKVVLDSATPITKQVVQNILYSTSPATIEKSLASLQKNGKIQLITKGRYSKYFRM
ncbi:MAG: Fic family protein [Bacilli bacterium]|nr:Fic family protein [Bacilli bacterium]